MKQGPDLYLEPKWLRYPPCGNWPLLTVVHSSMQSAEELRYLWDRGTSVRGTSGTEVPGRTEVPLEQRPGEAA